MNALEVVGVVLQDNLLLAAEAAEAEAIAR